ncbi:Cytochrome c-type biogenesis protein CcmE, heme chaperone [hydrothermal vent metagenome]|uniref:Cytochrome c-type biogenesis protein CcmE, heme chaperone n=1 Tax=hydrothermal vent metagenome TaxID=652676 RepID=A0A3B0VUV1_9ZZZZ
MTPTRKKRLMAVLLILIGVGIATALFLTAFKENILFYKSPTEVLSGDYPKARNFRIGGMVKVGSIVKSTTSLDVEFLVTDYANDIKVQHNGLLPDLFRDDQGMIAIGQLDKNGVFQAEEILAKHDENYMPPEVAASLKGHNTTKDKE